MTYQQEDAFKHYHYPEEVINYFGALLPDDIKGENVVDSYQVSLKEFCVALQSNLL